jgi:hypothetical protein
MKIIELPPSLLGEGGRWMRQKYVRVENFTGKKYPVFRKFYSAINFNLTNS